MTKQERIFDAIGGVDEILLARSERTARRHTRRWRVWGAAMAACLALILLLWGMKPQFAVVKPDAPVVEREVSVIDMNIWDDGPRLHLLSFQVPLEKQSGPQFYLYVNEEDYNASWQDSVYVIQPKKTLEDLPACVMDISHIDTAPEQAAEAVRANLESRYTSVVEIEEITDEIAWKFPANTLCCFVSSDGLAWDDAQRETFLVNDGQGGAFIVSYGYFMEAAEGHGTRFAGMAATFQVIPKGHAAARMTELDDTVEKLTRGIFYGGMEEVEDLLLPTAEVDRYDAGIADDVVIRRIDKVINHETAPTAAIVTIPYSLSPEEPGGTLVMRLIYDESSNLWLAWRIGLEQ